MRIALSALLIVVGCMPPPVAVPCAVDADCARDMSCSGGVCLERDADSPREDAGAASPQADAGPDPADAGRPLGARAVDGLMALYLFDEGDGERVTDSSGIEPPLDLVIQDTSRVTWLERGLQLDDETTIEDEALNASRIHAACQASNQLTLEAWVTPSAASVNGPDRIISYSANGASRNFMLGYGRGGEQVTDEWQGRIRTENGEDGYPRLVYPVGSVTTGTHHVVLTFDAASTTFVGYLDGQPVALQPVDQSLQAHTGGFADWDISHQFLLANEVAGEGARAFRGVLNLVAVYCRALSAAEVGLHFELGF